MILRSKRSPTLVVLLLWCSLPARGQDPQTILQWNIPAGPAERTLQMVATRASKAIKVGVLFGTDDVRGYRTGPVHGAYTTTGALEILLKGTPIRYEWTHADTITLTIPGLPLSSSLHRADIVIVRSALQSAALKETGSASRVLSRSDIDAAHVSTVSELMRTIPQVFGGGPTEDTRDDAESHTNAAFGRGINLRGLGAGASLILINGRRLPASGSEGRWADVAGLPLSLIERIEILTDSSSTQYGADAVGGVVNIVLKDSFAGSQTEVGSGIAAGRTMFEHRFSQTLNTGPLVVALDVQSREALPAAARRLATSDLTRWGGTNWNSTATNPATITQGAETFAVPRGQDGKHLTPSMLLRDHQNLSDTQEGVDILPSLRRWTAYATANRQLSEDSSLFGQALISERRVHFTGSGVRTALVLPTANPFFLNPAANDLPVVVHYDTRADLGPMDSRIGVQTHAFIGELSTRWNAWHVTATLDFASERLRSSTRNAIDPIALGAALAETDPASAFNPLGDGSHTDPDTLERIRTRLGLHTESNAWTSSLVGQRRLTWSAIDESNLTIGADLRRQTFKSEVQGPPYPGPSVPISAWRHIGAAFVTLRVVRRGWEASAGTRYEEYSDFGRVLTPRYGVRWSSESIGLRASLSRSMRPPPLIDLDERGNFVGVAPVRDASHQLLLLSGKNALLQEETARSWTAGVDLPKVTSIPGLTAAATYFHTRFSNRIVVPVVGQDVLSDPGAEDLVTLHPTLEQRTAVCRSAAFVGPADACLTLPITAIVDVRARNSALTSTSGVDLTAKYEHSIASILATYKVDGSYLLSFAEQSSPQSVRHELVSTQHRPIDFRLRGTLELDRGPMRIGLAVDYMDNYRDTASRRRVASWTTVGLSASYQMGRGRMTLSAGNLFAHAPPFQNNSAGIGYDRENGELTGRTLAATFTQVW